MKTPQPKTVVVRVIRASSWAQLFLVAGIVGIPNSGLAAGDEWRWQTKASMPWVRTALAACAVKGKIYVFGGYTFSPYVASFRTVAEYDPATDAWTPKADMPTTRTWLSCGAVNGRIYVIGGAQGPFEQGYSGLRTVEEYDPATDTWTQKADMPTGRGVLGTCVLDGKIYAIGGITAYVQTPAAVEAYDPATDTWTTKQNLPAPLGVVSVAVVNGKIYATGRGTPGAFSSRTDCYDPQTDAWTRVADMPTPRGFLTSAAVNGKMYAFGGIRGSSVLSVVEEYDPVANTWIGRGDMYFTNNSGITSPYRSYGFGSAVIGNRIYVLGGAQSQLSGDSAVLLKYTPPASDVAFANYLRFELGSTEAGVLFEQGPHAVEFGLPAPADPPLPGWDANTIGTAVAGSEDPPTLDETTEILTVPVYDTHTYIARNVAAEELGRLELLAVGSQKLDLNADDAIVDEAAGTIQVQFGGNLLEGQPAATFSVTEATGIYASDVHVLEGGLGFAGGYFLLRLDDDPSTSLQENILNAYNSGEIAGADVLGVWTGYWSGDYAAEASLLLGGKLIVNGSDRFLRLEWPSQADVPYTIQSTEKLYPAEWMDLTNRSGTGQLMAEDLPINQSTSFYRVQVNLP